MAVVNESVAADWAARARALAPIIEARTDAIEKCGVLPPDVLSALYDAQFFRMLLPRALGGAELDPAEFVMAVETLAQIDASTAWCVGQAAGCTFAAAYLDHAVAREIFGNRKAVLAWGPSTRNARAVRTGGGYKVTGAWMFASGSRHATWLGGHCTVYKADGTPLLDANGKPVDRTMLFPRARAEIKDVWQVVGLRGTGSDNYSVADLYVPEAFSFTRDSTADRREAGPLYRFPILNTYAMAFAGIALGIARAMLDSFVRLAGEKVSHEGSRVLRENAVIQSQTAVAEAKLRSSRAFLFQTLLDMWRTARAGESFSLDQRVGLRLASTYAIHQARDVANMAYHAAGATAIFSKNSFERRFRDINTVSQQVQAHSSNFELAGRVLLGCEMLNPKL